MKGKRYHLTNGNVDGDEFCAPPQGNRIYYDDNCDGFGLRVTAAGARAFVLSYWINGGERRITIGSLDDWSTSEARKEAKALKRKVDTGVDPLDERESKRKAAKAEREAPDVNTLADRYAREHLPRKRPRSQEEDKALLDIITADIGREKVADIDFTKVDRLHQKITKERGPFRANRVLALLSKMFSLSIKWKWRLDNPCVGIERNYEPKRQRYLSPAELERLLPVLDEEKDEQAADIIRLQLLTGARIGEILGADWKQFDLAAGLWTKPHTGTKQKEEHRLPLAAEAVDLLKRLKADASKNGKFVFPGKSAFVARTYDSFRVVSDRVRKAAEIEDVRPHDLRHSHASLMANAGQSLLVIGAALGHKSPVTTARYAHLADETLRGAVASIGSKVVPLKKAKA